MPTYLHALGSTLETLTLLPALDIPIPTPKSTYAEYAQVEMAVSGVDVGQGEPSGEWRWTYLTRRQRYQLRQFCPGLSAVIYVTLMTNEADADGVPVYETFLGVVHWPAGDDRNSRQTFGFALTFTHLERVEL